MTTPDSKSITQCDSMANTPSNEESAPHWFELYVGAPNK